MIDWRHWHNEPWLVGGLVVLGWLWNILAGPLRARLSALSSQLSASPPFPIGHAMRFHAALLVFYFAVGSPLDQIGERFLFSAHMLQHQLLIYPAAILFLLGLPSWMIDPVLGRPGVRRLLGLLFHPLVCGAIFTLVVSLWHLPELYDWALRDKLVHIVEHLTFFGAALLYWWPLLSPSRVFPPRSYGVQMLYLLGVVIGMTPVFAYITFSRDILYPTYEFAPRLFADFSATDDQLLAGTGMKLVGLLVSGIAFAVSFFRWFQAGEKNESRPVRK
ncbi:MAG: cytochrome c oxidase assembly protein [Opitutaceae bacterium]